MSELIKYGFLFLTEINSKYGKLFESFLTVLIDIDYEDMVHNYDS